MKLARAASLSGRVSLKIADAPEAVSIVLGRRMDWPSI
jgi:hypothetical protein